MEALTLAFFLALIANRLTAAIVEPVKQHWPALDLWWLIYPSWVIGGLLAWLAGANLFAAYFADPLAGRLLSAVVIGGGSNLLHDLFDK